MAMVILRTGKLKSIGNWAGSLAHTYRMRETLNADPERFASNTLQSSPHKVLAALKSRLPEKRRKDAVLGIEYFISASPEWFTQRSKDDQDKYFKDAREWLEQRHGTENVLDFSIHRDETSPHAVAYVVPLVDGKLNAKRFLGGRTTLSTMQTDFAMKVGRYHQLERGLEGSKAHHATIKQYYARVASATPEKTVVEIPDPSLAERLKPAAYGQRVAESIIGQVEPALKTAKALAACLRAVEKQLKQVNAAAAAATKAAKAERARANHYQEIAELFTPEEIEAARARRTNLEQETKAQKQAQEIAAERQRRINALPGLRRKTTGAEHTFVNHALEAIEQAGGDPSKVTWPKVEGAAALEAVSQHGQSPEAAARAICELSPHRANPANHAAVKKWAKERGPVWQQKYEAQMGRDHDLEHRIAK